MRKMTVGLVSHLVRDYNLGCSALAVSNIRLMDSVFAEYDVQPCYRVILSEPRYPVDLASYTSLVGVTSNPYEYRTYPRLKATIKNPSLIRKSDAFDGCDLLYSGGYDHKNYFGLSFSYRDFVDELVRRLSDDEGIAVHLVPHVVASDGGEGGVDDDYSACVDLRSRHPGVILPEPFESASEAKSYISSLDFFSGARMHSTIGAISSGVPVVPVAYSRKFNGLYGTLGYPYLIDAKADLTIDGALDLFFDYFGRRDELAKAVERAKPVYLDGLSRYCEGFAKAAGLA